MNKNDKNFKLITAIVIALVIFLILLVVGTGVLWRNDNSDIPVRNYVNQNVVNVEND